MLEFIFGDLNIFVAGGYSFHTPVASDSQSEGLKRPRIVNRYFLGSKDQHGRNTAVGPLLWGYGLLGFFTKK
jgi:hypothetical protein